MVPDQPKKYYFISAGQVGKDAYKISKYNVVTDVHPMIWLKEMMERLEGSDVRTRIDFYAEIDEEHYLIFQETYYKQYLL